MYAVGDVVMFPVKEGFTFKGGSSKGRLTEEQAWQRALEVAPNASVSTSVITIERAMAMPGGTQTDAWLTHVGLVIQVTPHRVALIHRDGEGDYWLMQKRLN